MCHLNRNLRWEITNEQQKKNYRNCSWCIGTLKLSLSFVSKKKLSVHRYVFFQGSVYNYCFSAFSFIIINSLNNNNKIEISLKNQIFHLNITNLLLALFFFILKQKKESHYKEVFAFFLLLQSTHVNNLNFFVVVRSFFGVSRILQILGLRCEITYENIYST